VDDTTITDFKRELAALGTLRDELKLKAHLARIELKSQLDELERKWRLAEEQLDRAKAHAQADGSRVQRELKSLLGDLRTGFQNAKRAFDQS
jgi:hypothetical protein